MALFSAFILPLSVLKHRCKDKNIFSKKQSEIKKSQTEKPIKLNK